MTTTEPTMHMPSTNMTVPANLPAKFRDPKTGAVRLDALVNSYLSLEQKQSTSPQPPASASDYDIDVSHGMFTADPEVNQKLFDAGCTNDQTQAVYDLAAEKLVPALIELAQDYQAQRETDRLEDAFGGPGAWDEMSRQLLAYGQTNLPPPVLQSLSTSYDGVMALHRMMSGGATPPVAQAPSAPPDREGDIKALMRDPRYWKKKDPAVVAKVTEGFKRLYS